MISDTLLVKAPTTERSVIEFEAFQVKNLIRSTWTIFNESIFNSKRKIWNGQLFQQLIKSLSYRCFHARSAKFALKLILTGC